MNNPKFFHKHFHEITRRIELDCKYFALKKYYNHVMKQMLIQHFFDVVTLYWKIAVFTM